MQKILIVATNVARYEKNKRATGLWLGELTHFYEEVTRAGFAVDVVSPLGGYVPVDPHSLKPGFLTEQDLAYYADPAFQAPALFQTKKPSEIDPDDYVAIYYTGGHGVVWDFPENAALQAIAERIYQRGGYVTSVCHGAVGLLNLRDDNGNYLIDGRRVTGFTNAEETLNGTRTAMPYLTETELKKRGANFVKKRAFAEHVVQDGRLITGQNPFSPRAVGKQLVAALNQQAEVDHA